MILQVQSFIIPMYESGPGATHSKGWPISRLAFRKPPPKHTSGPRKGSVTGAQECRTSHHHHALGIRFRTFSSGSVRLDPTMTPIHDSVEHITVPEVRYPWIPTAWESYSSSIGVGAGSRVFLFSVQKAPHPGSNSGVVRSTGGAWARRRTSRVFKSS